MEHSFIFFNFFEPYGCHQNQDNMNPQMCKLKSVCFVLSDLSKKNIFWFNLHVDQINVALQTQRTDSKGT